MKLCILIWRVTLIETDNVLKMIGLAVRARQISMGASICINDIKKNRIKLLIIAIDCSENTKKKVLTAAYNKNIELIETFSKKQLGSITGKGEMSVVGIKDYNFAIGIKDKITKEN